MSVEINWFPGHMKKALDELSDRLKLVDIVFETCDSRIPISSRNPELNRIIRNKRRIIVLNKADLADDVETKKWINEFDKSGVPAVAIDSIHKKGLVQIRNLSEKLCADILERARNKGRIGRPVRAMVVGIPNSGKSTLINAMCNRKIAITGDRPGVTRGFQWAKSDANLELMDMPGVLWPNLGTNRNKLCLALTGAIKTQVTDSVSVSLDGITMIQLLYPDYISQRYGIPPESDMSNAQNQYDRFLDAARAKGCVLSGGRVDEERFAALFLDDFRSGRIGRISLEKVLDKQIHA